jgi:hypothetical protein
MGNEQATKRPGPFAQDPSRTPPDKEDRENDYAAEKRVTGNAAKGPAPRERGKDAE